MTTEGFRESDEYRQLGSACYIRCSVGAAVATIAVANVNPATETTTYQCKIIGVPESGAIDDERIAAAVRRLIEHSEQRPALFIVDPDDTVLHNALKQLGVSGAAAVRTESQENTAGFMVKWLVARPSPESNTRRLLSRLASRGLLLEPFYRLKRLMSAAPDSLLPAHLMPPIDSYLRQHGAIDWPFPFLRYQEDGIRALMDRPALLLADDMGLGKTVQATAAFRILLRTYQVEAVLVVTPAAVMGQWYRALRDWAPELRVSVVHGNNRAWRWQAPAHVYLTTFETLKSDFTENPNSPPRRRTWGVVVLDEAQKIKNRDIDLSRICKRLPRVRSWALTGTPLENRVDDLRSICEFLLNKPEAGREISDERSLREVHGQLQLRRRKNEVLADLPPKQIIPVDIELGPRQRQSYDRAEREGTVWLRSLGERITVTHVFELITRLKQICNFCPETGESAKTNDIVDRLQQLEEEGHRSLIFSQYVDEDYGVAAIAARIARFRPEVFTGSLSMDEREACLRRFRNSSRPIPLVLSLRAGGHGLNLQEASYVFHFDRWWNPAVEQQAEDRSHRMGQTSPVTVYTYICRGTIEERIEQIITNKGQLFREWIDGVTLDPMARLTEEELFGLFGLTPPRLSRPAEQNAQMMK